MGRLTAVEKEDKVSQAVALSARSWTYTAIAEELGCSRPTVSKWIKDELAKRSEHREQDKEKAIAVYVEIQRAAWERLETLDSRSLNVSGLLNTIKNAQERIDKITGAEAPTQQDGTLDVVVTWGKIGVGELSAS